MKHIASMWQVGWLYLFGDDLISFYTFFTIIFAECAYIRAFYPGNIANAFTFVLIGYVVNVIICTILKGFYEGENIELLFSISYVIAFCFLLVIGCFINAMLSIILTIIPLIITALWIVIREQQNTLYLWYDDKLILHINKVFENKILYVLSQLLLVGGPFIAFTICLAMIPGLSLALKIVIPVIYLLIMPLIAFFEDESSARNIFELIFLE